MPELEKKKVPKDRKNFFDMLNTLKPRVVDKMVDNAKEERILKSKIDDEITVIPELKGIFTDGDLRRKLLTIQKPIASFFVDDVLFHGTHHPFNVQESEALT